MHDQTAQTFLALLLLVLQHLPGICTNMLMLISLHLLRLSERVSGRLGGLFLGLLSGCLSGRLSWRLGGSVVGSFYQNVPKIRRNDTRRIGAEKESCLMTISFVPVLGERGTIWQIDISTWKPYTFWSTMDHLGVLGT